MFRPLNFNGLFCFVLFYFPSFVSLIFCLFVFCGSKDNVMCLKQLVSSVYQQFYQTDCSSGRTESAAESFLAFRLFCLPLKLAR
jgi:hypothetical protein